MVAFGFGENDCDHLESAVCTLPLTLGNQIWIWICHSFYSASDCQPAPAALTTTTSASAHRTPFSDVHPSLWTLLQVDRREPPPSSPPTGYHPSSLPTSPSPSPYSLHEPKSRAHTAARTDPKVSVARGHRTTISAGGNCNRNRQILILTLSRRRCSSPGRPISISGPAPPPQNSGFLSACSCPCHLCLDPRRRTRAANKSWLRLHLHLQLHLHLYLHLQLAAKHHRGRQPLHKGQARSPFLGSGDLTPQRLIGRQFTGTGTSTRTRTRPRTRTRTGRGPGSGPAIHTTHPPKPRAVKAVSAAPHLFQRLHTLRSEIIVDQLNSPP